MSAVGGAVPPLVGRSEEADAWEHVRRDRLLAHLRVMAKHLSWWAGRATRDGGGVEVPANTLYVAADLVRAAHTVLAEGTDGASPQGQQGSHDAREDPTVKPGLSADGRPLD